MRTVNAAGKQKAGRRPPPKAGQAPPRAAKKAAKSASAPVDPPAPRPRNGAHTRARILEAAQRLFAEHGYAQAGLREIAAEAGVAVSLLPQHFGSKAELFEAALVQAVASSNAMQGPRSRLGKAIVEHALRGDDLRLPAMIVLSTGDAEAREITARVMREHIIAGLAAQLGPPDARARAMEMTMLATGFLIYARQLPIGEVSARTKRRFAAMLQAIVDEGA